MLECNSKPTDECSFKVWRLYAHNFTGDICEETRGDKAVLWQRSSSSDHSTLVILAEEVQDGGL
jgi:hypothetical protein